jgi:hypothetical protein
VGSLQASATARPSGANPFETDNPGNHQHAFTAVISVPKAGADQNYFGIVDPPATTLTQAAGAHTHKIISGGDSETRPINAYVYYLIAY